MLEDRIDWYSVDELGYEAGELYKSTLFYDNMLGPGFIFFHEIMIDEGYRSMFFIHIFNLKREIQLRRCVDLVMAVYKKIVPMLGHDCSFVVAPGHMGAEVAREIGTSEEVAEIQQRQLDAAKGFWRAIEARQY